MPPRFAARKSDAKNLNSSFKGKKNKSSSQAVKPVLKRDLPKVGRDVSCCCPFEMVKSAVPVTYNNSVLIDWASMWIRHHNLVGGYIPTSGSLTPGSLSAYLLDCMAYYSYKCGGYRDSPPFAMGSMPVPYSLAVLIKESLGRRRHGNAEYVPRSDLANATIAARVFSESGSYYTKVVTTPVSLISGEPIFGSGGSLTVLDYRNDYAELAKIFAAAGSITVDEIPLKTKGFDFLHNRTTVETPLPICSTLPIFTPASSSFGIQAVTALSTGTHPDERMLGIAAFFWATSQVEWTPKLTFRSALVHLGFDPMCFSVHAELCNLSKLRGLITSIAYFKDLASWSLIDQDRFVTALVAFVSYIFCKSYGLINLWGSNVPAYNVKAWCNLPTLPCFAEIGLNPRRVENTLFWPYLQLNSTRFVNGCSLMSLIQSSDHITPSFDEDFDRFPFDFTFSSGFVVAGYSPPPVSSSINYFPVNAYSEAVAVLREVYGAGNFVPMPSCADTIPAVCNFVHGTNDVIIGGSLTLDLPGPVDFSCFAVCTTKQCAMIGGGCLFTRYVVGKYTGYIGDSSGEFWERMVRAAFVTPGNIVAAGSGSTNNVQKTRTRAYYSQLMESVVGREALVKVNDLISMGAEWLAEGNPVDVNATIESVGSLLSSPHWLTTAVAGVAGIMYRYQDARKLLRQFNDAVVLIN